MRGSLAPFAIPLVIRLFDALPVTETLKHVKHVLREEGADPTLPARASGARPRAAGATGSSDPVLVLQGNPYLPLTPERWHTLLAGAGPRRL